MSEQKTTSRKKIEEFMKAYYECYNANAHEAATIDKLDAFYSDDFLSIAYFGVAPYPQFDAAHWKGFLVEGSKKVIETLVPVEKTIDDDLLRVTTRVGLKYRSRETNELLLDSDGVAIYELRKKQGNELEMTRLHFFCANPAGLAQLYGLVPPQQ
jgi:hypothetical protein